MIEKFLKILNEIGIRKLINTYFLGDGDLFIKTLTKKGDKIPMGLLKELSLNGWSDSSIRYLESGDRDDLERFIFEMMKGSLYSMTVSKVGDRYIWEADVWDLISLIESESTYFVKYFMERDKVYFGYDSRKFISKENEEKIHSYELNDKETESFSLYLKIKEILERSMNEVFHEEIKNLIYGKFAKFLGIDQNSMVRKFIPPDTVFWEIDVTNIMKDLVEKTLELLHLNQKRGYSEDYAWEKGSFANVLEDRGEIKFTHEFFDEDGLKEVEKLFNKELGELLDTELQKQQNQ
jgi:hypothetical protein